MKKKTVISELKEYTPTSIQPYVELAEVLINNEHVQRAASKIGESILGKYEDNNETRSVSDFVYGNYVSKKKVKKLKKHKKNSTWYSVHDDRDII
jgi:hypothetical protein